MLKGFKNIYHKEEYGVNKKFYDDGDFKKYHNNHDDFDKYYSGYKGAHHKGGSHKVRPSMKITLSKFDNKSEM